jgi:hypothetical protein
MRKWLKRGLISLALISTTIGNMAYADYTDVNVTIDGKSQSYDQPPVIIHDRTLVPLRGIFESLGAKVIWDGNTRRVTATKGNTTIVLQIGSKTAYKNGVAINLDPEPQIVNGRTMVPVRFVSEALGADVKWDGSTRTVIILSSKESNDVTILSIKSPVARNSYETVIAHVPPHTTASIEVDYKSGPSHAQGLEPKTAGDDGIVTWTWKVGGNTTLGTWPVTVTDNGQSAKATFEVVR